MNRKLQNTKDLIALGKLGQALDFARRSKTFKSIRSEIIQISYKFHNLKSLFNRDLVSFDTYNIGNNKLVLNLLSQISDVEKVLREKKIILQRNPVFFAMLVVECGNLW